MAKAHRSKVMGLPVASVVAAGCVPPFPRGWREGMAGATNRGSSASPRSPSSATTPIPADVVTDNDAVDDAPGETRLLRLGDARHLFR
jgi:hypothetical protein